MKRIGEILIENGSITPEQLDEALTQQKRDPGKLVGRILIELGYVTEEDIVIALSSQFNVPYLPIQNFAFNETIQTLLPRELVEKYLCVPLDRIGNMITVVMADPTNERGIQEIEAATKCKVQAFVATPTEISSVIQKYFKINVMPNKEIGTARVQGAASPTQKPTVKP